MSKYSSDRFIFCNPSLAEPTELAQSFNIPIDESLALSEISLSDAPWDKHRSESDMVQNHYERTKFQCYADRIKNCATLLDFRLVPSDGESYRLRLSSAFFCQWRRSLRIKARLMKATFDLVGVIGKSSIEA